VLGNVSSLNSKAQVSKKHHYLPIFYTKRWAGNDGRICEFSKPYASKIKPKRVHPAGTGYVRGLYDMKGLSEELKDQFERLFLKPVDAKAADALFIIENSLASHVWNSDDRSAWTRFILSLLMRMPEDVEHLKALVYEEWHRPDAEIQARYLEAKSDDDPATMIEWMAKNDPTLIENSSFKIATNLMNHQTIGEDINNFQLVHDHHGAVQARPTHI
jgi:Protein of unknown function (DUF4238)